MESGPGSDFADGLTIIKYNKNEKRRKGIASGFRNSIFSNKIKPSSTINNHNKCYENAEHWLRNLLSPLGYVEANENGGTEGTTLGISYKYILWPWNSRLFL